MSPVIALLGFDFLEEFDVTFDGGVRKEQRLAKEQGSTDIRTNWLKVGGICSWRPDFSHYVDGAKCSGSSGGRS